MKFKEKNLTNKPYFHSKTKLTSIEEKKIVSGIRTFAHSVRRFRIQSDSRGRGIQSLQKY